MDFTKSAIRAKTLDANDAFKLLDAMQDIQNHPIPDRYKEERNLDSILVRVSRLLKTDPGQKVVLSSP